MVLTNISFFRVDFLIQRKKTLLLGMKRCFELCVKSFHQTPAILGRHISNNVSS